MRPRRFTGKRNEHALVIYMFVMLIFPIHLVVLTLLLGPTWYTFVLAFACAAWAWRRPFKLLLTQ
jgi:hypothetical protein